jgi:hypothetical protein
MQVMVQAEKWDEILDGKTLPVYDKPRENAWRAWALGLAHASKGDVGAAKKQAKVINSSLKQLKSKTKTAVPPELLVAQEELKGQISLAANDVDRGLELLQQAARRERALRYSEPPSYPRPVLDVLGQFALRNGKLELAKAAFGEALQQYPASPRAERGLAETVSRMEKGVFKAGL